MKRKGKTVIALFSGGDAPGMNPFLRALVRLGVNRYAATVLGVKDGYDGLVRTSQRIFLGELTVDQLKNDLHADPGSSGLYRRGLDVLRLDHQSVSGIVGRGGIVLGSSRCPEFEDEGCRRQVVYLLEEMGVDAVVVCGGDGSLTGAGLLAAESGLQVIGVPATIDNDLSGTETALGVDTAVNTLMETIEHFDDTARSHHRVMVLETMGRGSGELARLAAVASGAEIVVTPERGALTEPRMQGIAERLENSMHRGRDHGIVLVAEGVQAEPANAAGPADALGSFLRRYLGRPTALFPKMEVRVNVLGYLQRGGSPTAADRILASQFAETAWEAIAAGDSRCGMVAMKDGRTCLRPFRGRALSSRGGEMYSLQKTLSKW